MNDVMKEKLEEIDSQLDQMPAGKLRIMYATIFLGLIAFGYYYFGKDLQTELESKETRLLVLEKKLLNNEAKGIERKIVLEKKKILEIAGMKETEKYRNTFLRSKLQGLDYLSTDAKGLADILERMLKHSVSQNVEIVKIVIEERDLGFEANVRQTGMIRIEGAAKFGDLLRFLRYVESQQALLKVAQVSIRIDEEQNDERPMFIIDITGYGVAL